MIAISLIIGASGGIGRAPARKLHAQVCRLAALAVATCQEAFGAAPRPLMRHRECASTLLLRA